MTTETESPEIGQVDLERLVEVAQLITAARDAMSDEIVTRIAGTVSESMILLDRLTRNEGLMRLLKMLDHPDVQSWLIALSDSLHVASKEVAQHPPAKGGIACLTRVMLEPGTQEGLRFVAALGKHISHSLREQHRHGVNP
ncbi:MAG: hypothetical protein PVG66_09865 [Chromatiales bacterium]|jgi:uncharacterized protein YjgD (DUF1641 family)